MSSLSLTFDLEDFGALLASILEEGLEATRVVWEELSDVHHLALGRDRCLGLELYAQKGRLS